MTTEYEKSVQSCYSTWGDRYYDEYYGEKAPYPPLHRDLLKTLLVDSGVHEVLDAGCGPASFLRELFDTELDLYGFDLTHEMVLEAKRLFKAQGLPANRVWQGSVTAKEAFRLPGCDEACQFESIVCVGVLPHIPPEYDVAVVENLYEATKPGGLVAIEARNQFFALFTQNRYTYQFFVEDLIRAETVKQKAGDQAEKVDEALHDLTKMFRTDLPPVRKGKQDEPGYDEVLSRTHNPLALQEQAIRAGFTDVHIQFYHYHCLPPMFEARFPDLFRQMSVDMEDPFDWRGYFMASAFFVVGHKP